MLRRQQLVQVVQGLAAEEGRQQPAPEDWLWAQDKAGRSVVNLEDPVEKRSWATALKVSEDEVERAVATVGTCPDAIRAYLAK